MGPAAPVRWPAEAIWESVAPLLPDFSVEILPEIDSSNSELMRRCRAGRAEPVLLVAERQSAGRGRLGRQWHSPPGSSLTFSLGLPLEPGDWSGLSLAVGVSLTQTLAQLANADVRIKWPNDLWLGRAKLAGILVETAASGTGRYAVVGVGINLCEPAPGWGLHPRTPRPLLSPCRRRPSHRPGCAALRRSMRRRFWVLWCLHWCTTSCFFSARAGALLRRVLRRWTCWQAGLCSCPMAAPVWPAGLGQMAP